MPKRRVTVRGIIVADGKLFMQKLKHSDDVNQFWSTPGGGLDAQESLSDGLTREMLEETGVRPEIGRLLFIQQFYNQQKGYEELEFFFHIANSQDYETIDLTATSHGEIEVSQFGFVDPKQTTILPDFLTSLDVEEFIASNQPAACYSYL